MLDLPPIDRFVGEYAFLSNFFPCELVYRGEQYPSVEHAYQASKSEDKDVRKQFMSPISISAGQAKKIGRQINIRGNWEKIKLQVMTDLIDIKFNNDYFRIKLLDTLPRQLIEGNWWGDRYWGMCNGTGKNNLGKILMIKREQLFMEQFNEVRI